MRLRGILLRPLQRVMQAIKSGFSSVSNNFVPVGDEEEQRDRQLERAVDGGGDWKDDIQSILLPKIHIFLAITLTFNVFLALLAYYQDSRHFKYCRNVDLSLKSKLSSKGLSPTMIDLPSTIRPEAEFKIRNSRLTHLVVPFHFSQEDKALELMEMWKVYPPCRIMDADDEEAEKCSIHDVSYFRRNFQAPLGRDIELVLFVSCSPDKKLAERLLNGFNVLPQKVKQCFKSAHVRFASLVAEEDTYLAGSRHMFERMLNNLIGITEASYVYYMEPDCRPIRPYWLSIVDSLTRFPNGKFWIKGSIYRGKSKSINVKLMFNLFHINGNAIYNLGDQAFRTFYFDQVRPYIVRNWNEGAYDTDIFKLLLDGGRVERSRNLAHLFQFSDFMQNYWHSNYSVSEIRRNSDLTVLVHGGTPHP